MQAIGMLVITALYNALRLRKEERKVKASENAAANTKASFDAMTVYHAKRLELEERKLAVERQKVLVEIAKLKERGITLELPA